VDSRDQGAQFSIHMKGQYSIAVKKQGSFTTCIHGRWVLVLGMAEVTRTIKVTRRGKILFAHARYVDNTEAASSRKVIIEGCIIYFI